MNAAPSTEWLATVVAPRPKSRPLILRLLMNPLGASSLLFLLVVIGAGVFAPLITPADPNFADLAAANAPAFSPGHLLGGDSSGRDVWARLLYGTRETMIACVIVLGVSLVLGVTSGLVAGYYRGRAEKVLEFVSDTIMSLPGIVLLIALYARTGPNMTAAMTVFGLIIAPTFFRLVRATVLAVRTELYIDAAKVVGLSDLRIVGRHVLSAVRGPVVIHSASILGAGISIQAGVDFLGLGDPSKPSWGRVLQESFKGIYRNPTGILWPALLISLTILALVLLGNALRDVLQASGSAHRMKSSYRRQLVRDVKTARNEVAGSGQSAAATGSPTDAQRVLSIRGLRIGYASDATEVNEVLRGVDFDLRRGEIHGLVGESGSGKSQVAFSVLGILPREAVILGGSIRLDGVELLADSDALRSARGTRIGYIPQEPMSNLDPSFTIGDQLVYGLRAARKMQRSEARAQLVALLTRVGITDAERVMRMYPHEISGGMAQRVLICGAIAPGPDVIIADEPTTALDVTVQAEVLELLRELSEERGLAMILVTHNLGVVADICETVSVMKEGEIVEEGAVDAIFYSPQHPYTRELLTSSRTVELTEVEP